MLDHIARSLAIALALAIVVGGDRPRAQRPFPPPTPFEALFAQYETGDYDVVGRTIQTVADLNHLNPPEMSKLRKWLGKWLGQPSRAKVAYLLDLAVTVEPMSRAATINLISEGRLNLVTRKDALGVAPGDDAFELAWHKTALALLEEIPHPAAESIYLDTIEHRYRARSSAATLDPRFVFQRGVAKEQRCWQAPEHSYTSLPGAAVTPTDVSKQAATEISSPSSGDVSTSHIDSRRECLADAIRSFTAATGAPPLVAEANTRAAWARFQRGEFGEALATINRAGSTDDEAVTYWNRLFRARILAALGADADAVEAYHAAIDAAPKAQSAQVGLALTLFKLKRIDDAKVMAAQIRALPDDSVDPWWTYLGADGRFVTPWMAEVRKLVR